MIALLKCLVIRIFECYVYETGPAKINHVRTRLCIRAVSAIQGFLM